MDIWTLICYYFLPIAAILTYYVYRKYSYWSDRGVKGPRPIFPFGYLLGRHLGNIIEFELEHKKKYGDFYGVYTGLKPTLTVSDVEMVKRIMIKDFHLFVNRRDFNIVDEYWSRNLFMIHSDDWKRIRSITTPAFTSGKLRRMFPLLKNATNKLESYLNNVCENGQANIDTKQVVAGFTIDVIASTSFGTDTDSNGNRNKFNPFLHHGTRLLIDISPIRLIAELTLPRKVVEFLNIKHNFPKDSYNFLVEASKTMVQRGGQRDDLIKLLKEAHISEDDLKNMSYNKLTATSDLEQAPKADAAGNGNANANTKGGKYLDEAEIIGQCILFFVAGFETTASTISNVLYEMTQHPDVQEKLYREVTEKLADVDPENLEKYYETITSNIPYLDAVFKETLRKYPVVARLERRLDADSYELGGIQLERDTLIEVPAVAVHYDEKNYENPLKYDPERFMPENKHKLNPYAYIPFGIGPRNCVGMRFAYQEAKICLASLIQNFVFTKSPKTPEKLDFVRGSGNLFAKRFEISVNKRQ